MNEKNNNFKKLTVYKKAFALAMELFEMSKSFSKDEIYALTTQIRKSSRSVCSSIAEGYRKRQYVAHFVSKISDADMENSETQVWLDFALACKYTKKKQCTEFMQKAEEIGRLLNHMMQFPEKYHKNQDK